MVDGAGNRSNAWKRGKGMGVGGRVYAIDIYRQGAGECSYTAIGGLVTYSL